MTPGDIITEEDIHRFIDGELSEERRVAVQAHLARDPQRAAEVFAEAERMTALRAPHPRQMFATKANVGAAVQLRRKFWRRWAFSAARVPVAAALVFAAGGFAGWTLRPLPSQTVDENFVLAAREALRVAQLDAGPNKNAEHKQEKIERLVGAINISVPPLPSTWRVTEVQVQPWQGKQSLVVSATTPTLGQVTLVAAPMNDEEAVPLTLAADGRVPTVYWQTGGTAYALMGPAPPDRLEREAKDIEVATRRNLGPKIRG
jgi:anti-sigma factor RsiW